MPQPKPKQSSKADITAGKRAAKLADQALAQSPLSREVDELGDLEAWARTVAAVTIRKKFESIDALRKKIRERFATADPLETQRAEGERYAALLGVLSAPVPMSFTRAGSRSLNVLVKQ